jgi:ribosomal protein S21
MSKLNNFNSDRRDRRAPKGNDKVSPEEYLRDLDRKKPPLPEVILPNNADASDVDRALKRFKSAVQKCGITAEVRKRRFYAKPSEKRQEKQRKKAKAIAKAQKKEARKNERM